MRISTIVFFSALYLMVSSPVFGLPPQMPNAPYTGRQGVSVGGLLADAMYRKRSDCDARAMQLSAVQWRDGIGLGPNKKLRDTEVLFTRKEEKRFSCIELNQSAISNDLKSWWVLVPHENSEFRSKVVTTSDKDGLSHYYNLVGYLETRYSIQFVGGIQDLAVTTATKVCPAPKNRADYGGISHQKGDRYVTLLCDNSVSSEIWFTHRDGRLQARPPTQAEAFRLNLPPSSSRETSEPFLAQDESQTLRCKNPVIQGVNPPDCSWQLLKEYNDQVDARRYGDVTAQDNGVSAAVIE